MVSAVDCAKQTLGGYKIGLQALPAWGRGRQQNRFRFMISRHDQAI